MKRAVLFLVFTLIFFVLCGCSSGGGTENQSIPETPATKVVMPNDDTVNGYRNTVPVNSDDFVNFSSKSSLGNSSSSKSGSSSGTSNVYTGDYTANINSKKLHKSTCGTAKRISEENRIITQNPEELIAEGYEPCKLCKP